MPTTQVVSAMTPTYRVKAPARRQPSTLIRGPVSCQGTGPFAFSAVQPHPAPGLPRRRCVRAVPALSQLASSARRPHRRGAQKLAGTGARPRPPCPISGVPTHKHRPARCACALGRPPVACSDASPACAGRPRRVWTQPRWQLSVSLAQWSRAPVYEAGGWTFALVGEPIRTQLAAGRRPGAQRQQSSTRHHIST